MELQVIQAMPNTANRSVTTFSYANDALGRRVARNADAFAYNARSELTNAVVSADVYGYGYDGIGNFLFSAAGTVTNTYTANGLNQYTAIAGEAAALPTYDADGNMTWDGHFIHTWDAENRLTKSQPGGTVTNGSVMVENVYDYMSRRHSKTVRQLSGRGSGYPLDPSQAGEWGIASTHTFVYDGCNLYREVEASGGATVTKIYVWGLDLSGTLQGAGGVGGLLAVLRNGTPYFPCYDANGNVTDYVDANGSVVAHREYDPFGNTTVATGSLVHDLHFWFSTKYFDEETGLYYYGNRFFAPFAKRFINFDPAGEDGGVNLYGMCGNDMLDSIDPFGLKMVKLDSLGKNGGELDINVRGESLCERGKTGRIIYDLTFITTYYVNSYGRTHDGELIIDGKQISVGEPEKTNKKIGRDTVLNYKVTHKVEQSECPSTDVSGNIDILISWKKISPGFTNPGTQLVSVKWKYKCKKEAGNGVSCCAGVATPFTVTIE